MFFLLLLAALPMEDAGAALPEARTRYVSYFTGRYAENGACADPSAMWVLEEKEISRGALSCVIHDVTDKDGALSLRLGLCSEGGERRSSRQVVFDLISDDALRATGRFGRVILRRCP